MEQTDDTDRTGGELGENPIPVSPKAGRSKRALFIILAVVVVGALAVVFYLQQSSKIRQLNQDKQDLSVQLAGKDSETKDLPDPTSATVAEPTETVYKANAGKFTLTLPKEYGVAQRNDGSGEGSALTSLIIAERSDKPGVLVSSMLDEVSVYAVGPPAWNLREFIANDVNGMTLKKQPNITIDGVSAEVYLMEGLGTVKKVYFTKNGIVYRIELINTTQAAEKKLQAVLAGFKFN